MAKQWLVKIGAQDEGKDPVLLHVTSEGSECLDLDLVATESTAVFKGKLRKRKLEPLRAKNYSGTEDEWEAILKNVLLEGQSTVISDDQKQSLEVRAAVKGREGQRVLLITFRIRIDDITQRIGAIELSENDTEEISLFDWAVLAVDQHKSVERELFTISKQAAEDEAMIASLRKQLTDLTKAKAEHEGHLISKFVLLLNEKKAKIRDQARIIKTAKVDNDKMETVRGLIDSRRASHTTRRVIKRSAPDDDSGEDESLAFETQEDRREQDLEQEVVDSDRQTTPDIIESEASDDELPMRSRKRTSWKASPQKVMKNAPIPASVPPLHASPSGGERDYSIRSKAPRVPVSQPALGDDEETASEDDEL